MTFYDTPPTEQGPDPDVCERCGGHLDHCADGELACPHCDMGLARENAETADLVRDRDEWQRVAAQRGEELERSEREVERLRGELQRMTDERDEAALRLAESEAAQGELRRRVMNQRESLACPRLEDAVALKSLREQLAESEKKCQALTVESEGWARQVEEATGLLRNQLQLIDMVRQHPLGVQMMQRTLEEWSVIHAFLSRAPAQAAEPETGAVSRTYHDRLQLQLERQRDEHMRRAESAESKLAAAAAIAAEPIAVNNWKSLERRINRIRALLAPSQGEGGGGK